jgi:AcrR family transcriptional regulator
MTGVPTKQHILEATINAIETHGLPGLTTRLIAAQAGVNNAALHYYYGTKEALVEAALTLSLDHMLADADEILGRPVSVRDRLRALYAYLIDGTYKFPNLIRAHLWSPLVEGTTRSPFERMQGAWADRLWLEVHRDRPHASEADVRLALHSSLGGIVFLVLVPPGREAGARVSLKSRPARERYAAQLADFVLASASGRGAAPGRSRT